MGKVKEICSDEYRELTIKREFLNEAGHFRVVDTTETNCVICGKLTSKRGAMLYTLNTEIEDFRF